MKRSPPNMYGFALSSPLRARRTMRLLIALSVILAAHVIAISLLMHSAGWDFFLATRAPTVWAEVIARDTSTDAFATRFCSVIRRKLLRRRNPRKPRKPHIICRNV